MRLQIPAFDDRAEVPSLSSVDGAAVKVPNAEDTASTRNGSFDAAIDGDEEHVKTDDTRTER